MSESIDLERICVFCGSHFGADPAYRAAAAEFGREMVERNLGLVYGGGDVGLMGALADTVMAAGGEVIGVIPRSLRDREVAHHGITELQVVDSMHERKRLMYAQADAVVALPGGIGTLDELFEAMTWNQLGIHHKPAGLRLLRSPGRDARPRLDPGLRPPRPRRVPARRVECRRPAGLPGRLPTAAGRGMGAAVRGADRRPRVSAVPTYLDLDGWRRREHFEFFRGFDNPFFNVCAPVEVTALYERSRQPEGPSFFLATLHLSLTAANEIEEFRYRIRGHRVLIHDFLHASSTVLRSDGTFGFAYFELDSAFSRFQEQGEETLARVGGSTGTLDPLEERDDLIHYSVIPWVSFTSFSHARNWGKGDSVPKLTFGKHFQDGEKRRMPVSVEVHHALMDGLHVGRFFERFQALLDDLSGI